jgi:hypothetical protein
MTRLHGALVFLLFTAGVCAQGGSGTLSGTVTDPNGMVVATAQAPTLILRLTEGEVVAVQQFFVNGRHPSDPDPSWLGHSVARWDRDVLVVETVGYNDRNWLDIYPHTEKLRVVERWRRPDLGHLEVEFTLEHPGTFTKPWTVRNMWDLARDGELFEYVCENNRDGAFLAKP